MKLEIWGSRKPNRVGKNFKNKHVMPYAFKVTAKQNIGGKIAKGMSVQVVEKATSSPQIKTILEAFKNQFGIEIKGISVSTSYFTVEKL